MLHGTMGTHPPPPSTPAPPSPRCAVPLQQPRAVPQAAKLTGQELEESVERLYYHERQKQKDRQANLTQKWIRQEASKVPLD